MTTIRTSPRTGAVKPLGAGEEIGDRATGALRVTLSWGDKALFLEKTLCKREAAPNPPRVPPAINN